MHLTKMHFYYRNTEERLCLYSGDKKIKKCKKIWLKPICRKVSTHDCFLGLFLGDSTLPQYYGKSRTKNPL